MSAVGVPLHLRQCVLERFALARSRWASSSLDRVRFVACDLRGADLSGLRDRVHAVLFEDCDLDGANLGGLPIAEVLFARCSLAGTIMPSA